MIFSCRKPLHSKVRCTFRSADIYSIYAHVVVFTVFTTELYNRQIAVDFYAEAAASMAACIRARLAGSAICETTIIWDCKPVGMHPV